VNPSILPNKSVHLFHPSKVQTNPSHLLNRGGGQIKFSPAKQATTESAWAGPRLYSHWAEPAVFIHVPNNNVL